MKLTIVYMILGLFFAFITFVAGAYSDACFDCVAEYSFSWIAIPFAVIAVIFLSLSIKRLAKSVISNQVNEYGSKDLLNKVDGLGE